MPYETHITADGRGILRSAHGTLAGEEVLAAVRRLPEVLAQRPINHILVDFSDVDRIEVATADVQEMGRLTRALDLQDSLYVAHVATDDLMFGLVRMFESLADHPKVTMKAFHSRTEAEAWLASLLGLGEPSD